MNTSYFNSVVAFGNLKTAAVYFDRVLPVGFTTWEDIDPETLHQTPETVIHYIKKSVKIKQVLDSLIENDTNSKVAIVHFDETYYHHFDNLRATLRNFYTPYEIAKEQAKLYLSRKRDTGAISKNANYAESVDGLSVKFGITEFGLFLPSTEQRQVSEGSQDLFSIISGISLIDAEHADWEQIISLREDSDSKEALRRFRLFTFDNYRGKSKSYIEDDIAKRIADL